MILRSVLMVDFGLYAGSTELDMVPRRRGGETSPIILVGGRNGAGKTTLLEAVRLSLYGRRALGSRIGQSDYEAYLRRRINRSAVSQSAAVGLEFDYSEAGQVHRYRIRREWVVRGKSVVESLQLDKDGAPVTSVPRDEWQNFLQELVPPGVSQLFFFDGEKISEIAEGEDENEQLGEAVRALLGIELVGRLRADIGLYLARHLKEDDSNAAARLEAITRDLAVIERQASELADDVAERISMRDSQARAAEQTRRQFVAEGGDVALQRAKTELERERVKREIAASEHELKDLANRLLPFAMAPRLISSFKKALERSRNQSQHQGSFDAARSAIVAWRANGAAARSAAWEAAHWKDLLSFLDRQAGAETTERFPALQEAGDGDLILARMAEVDVVRARALVLLKTMDDLTVRARELDQMLARADNAATGALLDDLLAAEQKVAATEFALTARQEELKGLKVQLVQLERERRRVEEELAHSAKALERASLAARTAQVLADYEERLLERKISQLRKEFVERFNHLARKRDFIADVRIDPHSFAATLIDRAGIEIPKASLSAGEKQIYAIAMLWALAKTSGRPLPMIIDTPLARLDIEHRSKLTENYFPVASHQVILLSTDTEIDDRLYERLRESVSHSYLLDFDQQLGQTKVRSGYFEQSFEEDGRALQQA
ncbi:DNA sulfur modification protein DndD [Sinorhizobium sp. 8-89]|uniref:DNA sulfur modification protein DndD n=1 Tax=Sinorhizobium sp. 7-81 TaxID=3049087 RepID=UPI0024C3B5F7|nr:DNA sulfur modification protein DndD [Sinorhizobium sp. 7-81]MDK1389668.1 DNA sulfur modification protein DndD [Sinorhizobium sp. 7-81]